MSSPKVVHCKVALKGSFIYVGRPTKWGNPFSHKEGTTAQFKVDTREEAVAKYQEWICYGEGQHLLDDLGELRRRDLGCWCAPKRCHADVLLWLANMDICRCSCHVESPGQVIHVEPCCSKCYRRYLDKNGSIDWEIYFK